MADKPFSFYIILDQIVTVLYIILLVCVCFRNLNFTTQYRIVNNHIGISEIRHTGEFFYFVVTYRHKFRRFKGDFNTPTDKLGIL